LLLLHFLFDRAPAARLACALSVISLPLLFAAPPILAHPSHPAKSAKIQAQNKAIATGSVVQAANAFRGTRYVMGGTSRSGFDCSGFVRFILSATDGVELPRTATEQYYHGTAVSVSQAEPGDLVFFKNTYKRGISHVGIYIGGGQFIHAANAHKGVRTDSLSSSYYQAHFAGLRRVLPAEMRTAAALR
jgi:cell wall-associated NlpC family hydrolase